LKMDKNSLMRKLIPVAAGVAFILLSILTKIFGESNGANVTLFFFINNNQIGQLNGLMVALSVYGREYVWIPVVALLWIFGRLRHKRSAFLMASAFVIGIILGVLSKQIMAEPRPFDVFSQTHVLLEKPQDFSYPSGHALIVSIGALISLLTLPKKLSVPLSAEALLVSYSRVYVGVHWPVDVLAGWLLGGFCATFVVAEETKLSRIFDALVSFWNKLMVAFTSGPVDLEDEEDE